MSVAVKDNTFFSVFSKFSIVTIITPQTLDRINSGPTKKLYSQKNAKLTSIKTFHALHPAVFP